MEYTNSLFVDFCDNLGIPRELMAPSTTRQNSPVKSAISRAFKAGQMARLGVPKVYPDVRLEK